MLSSGPQPWSLWADALRFYYYGRPANGRDASPPAVTSTNGQSASFAAGTAPLPFLTNPWYELARAYQEYWIDSAQRTVLFWDVLRQRADNALEHHEHGKPPLLKFEYEMVVDGRTLPRPVNYAMVRVLPPAGVKVDSLRRPFVVIDPRAGHGPGIGGFKEDSEIGDALHAGHPVYFVTFFPEPMPGQVLADIVRTEALFLEKVHELHPQSERPVVIGNCQGGWATAILASAAPAECGPVLLAGAPLSYWAGREGENPMRCNGGICGGSWMALMLADLGNGKFDGAYLVENFENLNPANSYWTKYYSLYSKIDIEAPRFLEFERWWNGFFVMNKEEFQTIVEDLFIGNKLAKGELTSRDGSLRMDMRNIKSPIVIFCSWGDNITPPQQALNWILDLYSSVEEIQANEQTIVYNVHQNIGHLGIFVSGQIAKKEYSEIFENLEVIEMLPPGLYEMEIVPREASAAGDEYISGAFETIFHERTLDDIRAYDDGRADEQPFEVVERVSQINGALYEQYLAPTIRAFSTEASAQMLRASQPSRLVRTVWSEKRNPYMASVGDWAEQVRRNRRPVSESNPFLQHERRFSELMVRQLNAYRDLRDRWTELTFKNIYSQPWLRAAVGLPPADPAAAERPRAPRLSPDRRELHELRIKGLLERAGTGTPLDAFVRGMLYLRGDRGPVGEREYHMLLKVTRRATAVELPSTSAFRKALRDQSFLLKLHQIRALEALPAMLTDTEQRRRTLDGLRRVCEQLQSEDPAVRERFTRIETSLGIGQA
jgi:pimeloyl-ACP methyl ester carboxylesterase